jgi:hypothetical protein
MNISELFGSIGEKPTKKDKQDQINDETNKILESVVLSQHMMTNLLKNLNDRITKLENKDKAKDTNEPVGYQEFED